MNNLENILETFQIFAGIYGICYVLLFVFLAVFSFLEIKKYYHKKIYLHKDILIKSNHAVGVSIIAPAFNEALTIIENVKSLLSQEYPKFEVIIINDGSSDNTLDLLIQEFKLEKVDFFYQDKIKTQPVKGHYKSNNPVYKKLLIVDKENGKSKADASNAGINSSKYPLFLCTDVDCILRKDTIAMLVKPFIEEQDKVIATGGAIRISNSCEIKEGEMLQSHYPVNFFARFQELEYLRAFLFGRMAWSRINGLLLVSGGLGMFDKDLVIEVGGYWHKSLGEDMELITRMRKRMHEKKEKFYIKYIPETLCWTEVPYKNNIFLLQRTRWARGLIQTLYVHKKLIFNFKYGKTAFMVLPYFLLFEFIVPILEVLGLASILIEYFFFAINIPFFIVISVTVYLFYCFISLLSFFLDQMVHKQYSNIKEMLTLIIMIFLEPFVYHPINVFASLKGYWNFIINKEKKWGVMSRKGYTTIQKK